MALMILKRLPTEKELDECSLDYLYFSEDFNRRVSSNSPFEAFVKDCGDFIMLGDWSIGKADWFEVIDSNIRSIHG
ncbi:hypothetical protein [Vibrio rotiferianus]|uniref:hypothetical protein n=1 Tax=Vibrio rotiferianus TaxID=190895 RepID=UPI0003A71F07|nr:hypothetical protein [Vibrio rotiferianus]PIB15126.1 hypothetical protein B853_15390 [Vibrio rotiferianus CAIM 577 = LMG 21460]